MTCLEYRYPLTCARGVLRRPWSQFPSMTAQVNYSPVIVLHFTRPSPLYSTDSLLPFIPKAFTFNRVVSPLMWIISLFLRFLRAAVLTLRRWVRGLKKRWSRSTYFES